MATETTEPSQYQVIARRWRPKSFDELVGQNHITTILKNAITRNRIAHAYLFLGPRGTGKTTTARILATALNTEGGPNISPNPESAMSKAIMKGSCMDVIEIDGASNNGVEQVRQIREECQYAPAEGSFKIYIIDEVHMLTTAAFNALLKTLEEPPAHVKFILATTEVHKVPLTIQSRCQRFEFKPIADNLIIEKLAEICKKEGIGVEDEVLPGVAKLAQGGMRDAQSILDQLISFCGEKVANRDVIEVYGLASREEVKTLVEALSRADYQKIVQIVEQVAEEGKDLFRLLLDVEAEVEEALMQAVQAGGKSDLLGQSLSKESLMRMLEALNASESRVRGGLSEKVNFEVALFRAVEASRTRAIDNVIRELTELAEQLPHNEGVKKKSSESIPVEKPQEELLIENEVSVAEAVVEPKETEELAQEATEMLEKKTRGNGKSRKKEASAGPKEIQSEVEKLPESTRKILDEELRARFTGLRDWESD